MVGRRPQFVFASGWLDRRLRILGFGTLRLRIGLRTSFSHRRGAPPAPSRRAIARGADLREGLRFDLPHPFARDRETPPDLFESELAVQT
jgi:hypothetical protein